MRDRSTVIAEEMAREFVKRKGCEDLADLLEGEILGFEANVGEFPDEEMLEELLENVML
jgi:predicted house-cleaning noncanonical NTP pyrophosphatase (MazG superfamily)